MCTWYNKCYFISSDKAHRSSENFFARLRVCVCVCLWVNYDAKVKINSENELNFSSIHGKWNSDQSQRFQNFWKKKLVRRTDWATAVKSKCQVHPKLLLNGLFVHNWRLVDRKLHQRYSIRIRAHNQIQIQTQNMTSNVILIMKIPLRLCTNGHQMKRITQVIHRLL